jgi:hypothetical protein
VRFGPLLEQENRQKPTFFCRPLSHKGRKKVSIFELFFDFFVFFLFIFLFLYRRWRFIIFKMRQAIFGSPRMLTLTNNNARSCGASVFCVLVSKAVLRTSPALLACSPLPTKRFKAAAPPFFAC